MREQTTSFADELFGVLQHVHTALERHEIWHCLLFGTLLGAIRDGDIISWDHDIDLMIRPVDLPRVLDLNSELEREGLEFRSGRSPAGRLALNPGDVPWFNPAHVDIMRPEGCRGELYAPTLFADGVLRLYDFEHEVAHWPQSSFPIFAVEGERTALVIALHIGTFTARDIEATDQQRRDTALQIAMEIIDPDPCPSHA